MRSSTLILSFSAYLFVLSFSAADADRKEKEVETLTVAEDKTWSGFPDLVQVPAVSVDRNGNLHIFHRGDRLWGYDTFDENNRLIDTKQGPIPVDTVLVVDTTNGKILYSWGAHRFYMPHGLTVDEHGNTWITDVGLHQVFKFRANESSPELTLGDAFNPGSDNKHFCKPTDVAVMSTGRFFVSDGYCNSRVLMYSKRGRLLRAIESKDGMHLPHSLTLVPQHDAICVADRENRRVLCYNSGKGGSVAGTPLGHINSLGMPYGVDDTRGKQLFVLNGFDDDGSQSEYPNRGLVIDVESGRPMTLWGPEEGFLRPHDLAVSPDGKFVYAAEIHPNATKKVYKFNILD